LGLGLILGIKHAEVLDINGIIDPQILNLLNTTPALTSSHLAAGRRWRARIQKSPTMALRWMRPSKNTLRDCCRRLLP
jgi:hypothetical protein